jgi:CHAD domain-containing protein
MEIFDEACGGRYKETIKAVRKIQEILGLMHDCDVWIATLEEQWLPHEEVSGEKKGESGLIALLEDRKEERNVQYRKFLQLWEKFRQKDPAGEGNTSLSVGKFTKK